jgi:hypothetical protein
VLFYYLTFLPHNFVGIPYYVNVINLHSLNILLNILILSEIFINFILGSYMEYVSGTVPLEALCIMQLLVQTICLRTNRFMDTLISGKEVAALAKASVDYFSTKVPVSKNDVLDSLIALTKFVVPYFGDSVMTGDIVNVYQKGLSL